MQSSMPDRVDRETIARGERRRQALEALEFERARADALRERLEAVVVELDGAAIDESAFARMTPEDVAVVRPALQTDMPEPEAYLDETDEAGEAEDAAGAGAEHAAWLESEIERLVGELAECARRQQAFERYLDALRT
jgi:hypothetical protein